MLFRPYALLTELTYRCPLHCPYCSNPVSSSAGNELCASEWCRVIREAAALGVLQLGFSGGEPLLRSDLTDLIIEARGAGLYTNLITSGVGLDERRARELREAGLDSVQLSFQAEEAGLADAIAGARAHGRKIQAANACRTAGLPLSINTVLHRANIDRLSAIIEFAESLHAERLELANVQYYGWGFLNRRSLLPTREQVQRAYEIGVAARERLRGRMEVFYVLPDYYEQRPKPCLHGWGRRYLAVNPVGDVLPCPTASAIPGLHFDNVRNRSLAWIWSNSDSFNRFRGTEWMPEPCRSCPERERDFGGCRCQAALFTGDAANTDPVCTLSPHRPLIDAELEEVRTTSVHAPGLNWRYRENPVHR
ncbi:MAG TPA: pyrroloquinoline quinone biosynthesis protein PqqE [Chthoniobacterales bacterium]